jgi:membrane protease YdiL (CAAX protease family)
VNQVKKEDIISPGGAILVVVVTFVVLLFVGAALYILVGNVISSIIGELLILAVPLGYMLLKKVDVRSYVGLEIKPRYILLGITLGILVFFFDDITAAMLVSILGPSQIAEESNKIIMDLISSPSGLLSAIVWLSLAGVCEEFTFRAFLQNTINRKYSFIPAVLVSSLAFGLFHFDPQLVYIIATFLAGLVLGYIYHHWHSYITSAVAHSTVNLIILAIMLVIR